MSIGAVLVVFAVITGVMLFLAYQQSRIKKQIEEMHRKEDPSPLPPTTPIVSSPKSGSAPITGPGPASAPPSDKGPTSSEDAGGHH